jgi:hypothetical protein
MVKKHSKPDHVSLNKLLFLVCVFVKFIFFSLYIRREGNFRTTNKPVVCFDYFFYKVEDYFLVKSTFSHLIEVPFSKSKDL